MNSLFFLFFSCLSAQAPPIVTTPLGKIQGVVQTVTGTSAQAYFYGGIPYGVTTRWQPAKAPGSWGNATLMATQYGPCCPQNSAKALNQSEDCLSLNIWTPTNKGSYAVLIWIHGGGFVEGCTNSNELNGTYLAAIQNTTVVTINYRLGALGFLDNPYFPSGSRNGNFGIMDQQLAFNWVRNYISYFNGDPTRITISGQSAGAMSTTLHLVIKSSFSYYSRAIIESNPAGILYRTSMEDLPYTQLFAQNTGCVNASNITCLQNLPLSTILAEQGQPEYILSLSTKAILPWAPNIDGNLITAQPLTLFVNGNFNRVPVLLGTVHNETAQIASVNLSATNYTELIYGIWGFKNGPKILQLYPAGNQPSLALVQLSIDYLFLCPTRFLAETVSKSSATYLYTWMRPTVFNVLPDCVDEACHTCEIPYVFGTLPGDPDHPYPIPGADMTLSENSATNWTDFVWNELRYWPLWNNATKQSVFMDTNITIVQAYRDSYCTFWDGIGYNV